MCLLLFAQGLHPRYPLVVAANRDEFHSRPTAPAAWWEACDILAGRDRQAGGTWLGVSASGRFAALTNYREPGRTDGGRASRGELVVNALRRESDGEGFLRELQRLGNDYNGFNLVFGDAAGLYSYNNQDHATAALPDGLYGLSNHLLETPWPKVRRGKALLQRYLESAAELEPEPLFELLGDRHLPPDEELPETGVGREWERLLAPMCIVSPHYGTRCSTVVLVDHAGRVTFAERTYEPAGEPVTTREFSFDGY